MFNRNEPILLMYLYNKRGKAMFKKNTILITPYKSIFQLWIISLFLHTFHLKASFVKPKKDLVKIYKEPNKKSEIIGNFCIKDLKNTNKKCLNKFNVLETSPKREGLYWKVLISKNKHGYVSILKVKKAKSHKTSSFTNILRDAVQKKMSDTITNSRQRSTVMGVRGLDENEKVNSAGHVSPNLRLVNNMEKILINQNDLDALEEEIHTELSKQNP